MIFRRPKDNGTDRTDETYAIVGVIEPEFPRGALLTRLNYDTEAVAYSCFASSPCWGRIDSKYLRIVWRWPSGICSFSSTASLIFLYFW